MSWRKVTKLDPLVSLEEVARKNSLFNITLGADIGYVSFDNGVLKVTYLVSVHYNDDGANHTQCDVFTTTQTFKCTSRYVKSL